MINLLLEISKLVILSSNIYKSKYYRVSGATQFLGFSKLLRLSSPNDAALGKLITYCTGDQERIHEAIVNGVLLMGIDFNSKNGLLKSHTRNRIKKTESLS